MKQEGTLARMKRAQQLLTRAQFLAKLIVKLAETDPTMKLYEFHDIVYKEVKEIAEAEL